ncbi:flagellar hook capping FlgD N-terminal domain-containing protein [Sulfurimonas sp.]|uniref:flagellar hook capping FlgD N-terminal domain-containing protein n=1 Tax=Sulfurimonas sp. TaxID=2022749 RepID=UPI003568141C
MAINAYGDNLATNGVVGTSTASAADKTVLGKDDFMKLLLVQLQYQDPTEPMDSEKILTQTSQLAALESSENTNKALESLSSSMANTQEFSTIAAIGKRADLGTDGITHDEGSITSFEIYFPEDIKSGTVDITDLDGNTIASIPIEMPTDANGDPLDQRDAGVYQFDWDGKNVLGNNAESGIYRVNSTYYSPDGTKQETRLGAYPIESVRFEDGKALVKLGSNYVPLDQVVEVY